LGIVLSVNWLGGGAKRNYFINIASSLIAFLDERVGSGRSSLAAAAFQKAVRRSLRFWPRVWQNGRHGYSGYGWESNWLQGLRAGANQVGRVLKRNWFILTNSSYDFHRKTWA